jgi:hypothetical protein
MISSKKMTIAAALLAASVGSLALAQGQDEQQMPLMWGMHGMEPGMSPGMHGMMGGRGMMGGGMMGHGMGPGMMMGSGPMMEGRLAYLKAELAITDAQAAAWDAYVGAVKARATTMQDMHKSMAQVMQAGSAVARLQAHTQAMQSMVDSLKGLLPPTEALYAALNEEQKKKADLLLGGGCCMM